MKILIRKALIVDPNSPHHGRELDLRIENGIITRIGENLPADDFRVLEANELRVSPGWFDMRVSFCDPGYEYKENLESGAQAAAAGGFTGVACLPDTLPVIQTKSGVEYILNRSEILPVDIKPLGALTVDLEGKEITEMFDMHSAGAVGFSNGNHSLASSGVMQRALLYARGFDGLVCVHPEDQSLTKGGQMHEGINSTLLGLRGIPSHAEYSQIQRDLELLAYTGGRLHFSHISTAKSVEIIRQAKKSGLRVSCDAAIQHLLFEDSVLSEYDTNYKLTPPLRTREDILALKAGLLDGTIDCLVTDHRPEDIEQKQVEFDYAAPGMIGLQTFYNMVRMVFEEGLDEKMLIEKVAINPRKILGLKMPVVNEGEEAKLSLFSPAIEWEYNSASNRSRSANSPLLGHRFKGKAVGVINKSQVVWNPEAI